MDIGGFNLRGYVWIVTLAYAVFVLIRNGNYHFPIKVLIPLIIYLVLELLLNYNVIGLQATGMILSPFVFGMATSGFNYSRIHPERVVKVFWRFSLVFILIGTISSLVTKGNLNFIGSAALGMTITIFAAIAISSFITYHRYYFLYLYLIFIAIQVLAVTRMAIAMTLILLPLSFLRVRLSHRVLTFVAFLGIMLLVFYSESFQRKTFFSGEGSFRDISWQNKDFQTSGRSGLFVMITDNIGDDNILGKGPGSDYFFLKKVGFDLTEFHNDYLTLIYNYGIVGLIFFIVSYFILFVLLLRLHRKLSNPAILIISASSLILFLIYFGFSYTDNILKYNIFFTNIHFSMVGLVFGWYYHMKTNLRLNNPNKASNEGEAYQFL
jgi:hypothetical protein